MAATDKLSPLGQLTPKTSFSGSKTSSSAQSDMDFSETLKTARERSGTQTPLHSQSTLSSNTPDKTKTIDNQGPTTSSKDEISAKDSKTKGSKDSSDSKNEEENTLSTEHQTEAALLALQGLLRASTTVQAPVKQEGQGVSETPVGQVDTALAASSETMIDPASANLAGSAMAKTSVPMQTVTETGGSSLTKTTAEAPTTIGTDSNSSSQLGLKADSAATNQGKNGFQDSGDSKNATRPETILSADEKLSDKTNESARSNSSSNFASELLNAQTALGTKNGSNALNTVSPSQIQVYTPVSHNNWADEVGQKISWVAHQNDSKVELVLTPANMGKVEVSINLNGDQASAAFSAANPQTRDALEDALPRLREVLAQAGIQLGEANVNAGTQRQAEQHLASQGHTRTSIRTQEEAGVSAIKSPQRSARGNGLVDLFA